MMRVGHRRGFVLIMALLTLPIVVVSMESVATLAAADMHRTHDAMVESQTEQLLFAGALSAKQGQALTLPPSLSEVGARVDMTDTTITAHLGHVTQSIDFADPLPR